MHRRAEKLELRGEMVVSAEDEEHSGWRRSCAGASSSSSPQQPIKSFGADDNFVRVRFSAFGLGVDF